ncbi:hypothetical protein [uncultured Ruminococcus sp.]|uniref:hypothetical protein n=1 Tax=uncultured Ruminococcus sp. TaxID=165186 RepID=UPI002631E969|nr:hypothetical protein [uncultured Ruminococcus sp.]
MKKVSTYLPSLIISVIFVFLLIASSALLLVDINISSSKLKNLAAKNDLESKIYTELNKYYTDKYNTTGIPADVLMSSISNSYLKRVEEVYIDAAFDALGENGKMSVRIPGNTMLEENLDQFFNDFADENNYEKDDNFELKLRSTKDAAYKTIGSYCDVYKFSAMSDHGVLSKLSGIYRYRIPATAAVLTSAAVMIILLVIINRKKKVTTLYWCGISAIISGILGGAPSIYLIATRYFDSFSIKQAPVFAAFTSAMYKYTEAFMAVQMALIVVGISLVVIYGVTHEKKKYPDTKPTDIS